MTKFHIEWHKNPSLIPDDPVKNVTLNLSLLEMVKADLKSGKFIDGELIVMRLVDIAS